MNDPINPEQHTPDAQSGVKTVSKKNLQAASDDHPLVKRVGHSDTIEWNVPPSVLRNVSDGLYESEKATIREFVANAETATLRTKAGEARIVPEDYQPVIEVTYRGKDNKVVIRDNGIGMSSSVVLDVLLNIGVTESRNSSWLVGAFGQGLASFLRFVTPDGGMVTKTHSRITDENYSFYLNIAGCDPIGGSLPEDEYGTVFEMIHPAPESGGPTRVDIREYVEEYAKWLRVPVHYEEYNSDGRHVYDEDWSEQALEDSYNESSPRTVFEKEGFFRAVTSEDAEGETLLLSVPIDRNDGGRKTKSYESPFPFDVRLHAEDGKVVKGPHEGLTPVNDGEYQEMDTETQERFVPNSELTEEDLCLPMPTSSRDSLQENEEFWKWVSTKLNEKFLEECAALAEEFESVDDIKNLNRRDFRKLDLFTKEAPAAESLQSAFHEIGATISEPAVVRISDCTRKVTVVGRENSRSSEYAGVVEAESSGGTVFMRENVRDQSSLVSWDIDPENTLVEVDSDMYELFESGFGWVPVRKATA